MEFQTVKYKDKKTIFEVLVKPGTVLQYRDGKLGLDNTIFVDEIFTNYAKGDKAKGAELQGAFNTSDVRDCIKIILEKGEYHLSTVELKEKREQKKRELITYVHKYYIDPKTKKPHPLTRIENAFDVIKYNVDPNIPTERQALECVKLLLNHLPLKKSEISAELKIKHQHLGQCHGAIRKWAKVDSETYDGEGARYKLNMLPGDYEHFLKDIEGLTKGDYELKIDGAAASTEEQYIAQQKEQVKQQKKKEDSKQQKKRK